MPAALAPSSALPIAAAFEGDTAMPSTFLAMRSFTTCTCSSPPPCSPGPMYRHSMAPPNSFSAFLQPSRAWSKNGLFVFFGTRANTYFLGWASAPWVMPRMAAAATVALNSFPIMAFPPFAGDRRLDSA